MVVIDHVGTSACEKSMFLVQLVESSLFPTMELRSCTVVVGDFRFASSSVRQWVSYINISGMRNPNPKAKQTSSIPKKKKVKNKTT